MTRLSIKYLLSVCIILLCGYGHLSAHALKQGVFNSPLNLFRGSAPAISCALHHAHIACVKPASFDTEAQDSELDLLFLENLEENESASGKIHLKGICTSVLFTQALGYFFCTGEKISSFTDHFSYTASHRYLLFLVFRI